MISSREVGSVVATRLGRVPSAAGRADPQAAPATQAGDGVTLSSGVQIASAMLTALNGLPDTRPEVVARIQARVRSGVQPSGQQVARQMLSRAIGDRLGAEQ